MSEDKPPESSKQTNKVKYLFLIVLGVIAITFTLYTNESDYWDQAITRFVKRSLSGDLFSTHPIEKALSEADMGSYTSADLPGAAHIVTHDGFHFVCIMTDDGEADPGWDEENEDYIHKETGLVEFYWWYHETEGGATFHADWFHEDYGRLSLSTGADHSIDREFAREEAAEVFQQVEQILLEE